MVKVIYTRAVNERGRDASIGFDETSYEYKDEINSEEEFQKVKKEVIEELKNPETSLIKASFYTETHVPFEISYDDINPDDEYNNIDDVNEMTLEKILNDTESMPRWMWEMLNCKESSDGIQLPDDENALNEYFKTHGILR
jgi:hypothetical protein